MKVFCNVWLVELRKIALKQRIFEFHTCMNIELRAVEWENRPPLLETDLAAGIRLNSTAHLACIPPKRSDSAGCIEDDT